MPGVTGVVLAAGRGKRLKSQRPKVLHEAAGKPLLVHVLHALAPLGLERVVIVGSPDQEEIEVVARSSLAEQTVDYVVQDPPRGTGDALRIALEELNLDTGVLLVVPGDAPLLTSEGLRSLLEAHASNHASATVMTARVTDPTGYGRIVRGVADEVVRIVEEADATSEERSIDEINACVYAFDARRLVEVIGKVNNDNVQQEYYLTDVIGLLRGDGDAVMGVRTAADQIRGVNTKRDLAEATRLLRERTCARLLDEGITIVDPSVTYIDATVSVGRDSIVHPFTYLEGSTVVGEGAEVGPHTRVVDSEIGDGAVVSFSVVRSSTIGPGASVGPYASLRPGTRLERGARVGTFVETKQTTLGERSKAPHLSYLGDAQIGRDVNIGAGTITCNWDGRDKHSTVIDDEAYISSDTMLVAPVRIGKRAATGAGAVVRGDVPEDALAVGVPARVIEGKGGRMTPKQAEQPATPDDEDERHGEQA